MISRPQDLGDGAERDHEGRLRAEPLTPSGREERLDEDPLSILRDAREIVEALGSSFMDTTGDDGEVHLDLIARIDAALAAARHPISSEHDNAGGADTARAITGGQGCDTRDNYANCPFKARGTLDACHDPGGCLSRDDAASLAAEAAGRPARPAARDAATEREQIARVIEDDHWGWEWDTPRSQSHRIAALAKADKIIANFAHRPTRADTARAGEVERLVEVIGHEEPWLDWGSLERIITRVLALSAAPTPTQEGKEEGSSSASLPAHVACATATEAQSPNDIQTVRDWLLKLPELDMEDVVADGGITAAMVVQQEAREMARRLVRAEGSATPVRVDREEVIAAISANVRLEWRDHDHVTINYRSVVTAADAICSLAGGMGEEQGAAQSQPCAEAGTHIPPSPQAQHSDGWLDGLRFSRHAGERYRHVKRGSFYTLPFGRAEAGVQCLDPVQDGDTLLIYIGDDGMIWARPMDEFFDGRFKRLPGREGPSGRQGSNANTSEDGQLRDEPSSPTQEGADDNAGAGDTGSYRCKRCGRNEIDARANGCERGPCPMEFAG